MAQYLLSLHTGGGPDRPPPTPEQMQTFMQRIDDLESDMRAEGVFVFTGGLHGPDAATVVRPADAGGDRVITDGPFVESKEHLAGFYVIDVDDLDEALTWAGKVVDVVGQAIEVRPFHASRGA